MKNLEVRLSLYKSITQKGNALLGLSRFDEAKECYESLRYLNERQLADSLLKKLHYTVIYTVNLYQKTIPRLVSK